MERILGTKVSLEKKKKQPLIGEILNDDLDNVFNLVISGRSTTYANLLKVLAENRILTGGSIIAFDTTGIYTSFILPYLPGEHLKKIRKIKGKFTPEIEQSLKPVCYLFNTLIENPKPNPNVLKGYFAPFQLLLDLARLTPEVSQVIKSLFDLDPDEIINDILTTMAFIILRKDLSKYQDKIPILVNYLKNIIYKLSVHSNERYQWKQIKSQVLDTEFFDSISNNDLEKELFDSFMATLDYYISNSNIFKPPLKNPSPLDAMIENFNFHLIYLQDMIYPERILVIKLLFIEYILSRIAHESNVHSLLEACEKKGNISITLDELSELFTQKEVFLSAGAMLKPFLNLCFTIFKDVIAGTSNITKNDVNLFGNLPLSIAKNFFGKKSPILYLGKISLKDHLDFLQKVLDTLNIGESKGLGEIPKILDQVRPEIFLQLNMSRDARYTAFQVRDAFIPSIKIKPGTLEKAIMMPSLISAMRVGIKPSEVSSTRQVSKDIAEPLTSNEEKLEISPPTIPLEKPVSNHARTAQDSTSTAIPPSVDKISKMLPDVKPLPVTTVLKPVKVVDDRGKTRDEPIQDGTFTREDRDDSRLDTGEHFIQEPVNSSINGIKPTRIQVEPTTRLESGEEADSRLDSPSIVKEESGFINKVIINEDEEDRLPALEAQNDEGFIENTIVSAEEGQEDELSVILDVLDEEERVVEEHEFLTEFIDDNIPLIKSKKKNIGMNLDFNLILDTLLFKLEKVIKNFYGLNFLKELIREKEVDYNKAREMYFAETKEVLNAYFAKVEGNKLIYSGVKNAFKKIIEELGLNISLPSTDKLEKLEAYFVKSLSLSKKELLERIKEGSLFF
ncbi:MAG: hypothetical protein ACTSVI_15505 [Promethearchaeota archaeon]